VLLSYSRYVLGPRFDSHIFAHDNLTRVREVMDPAAAQAHRHKAELAMNAHGALFVGWPSRFCPCAFRLSAGCPTIRRWAGEWYSISESNRGMSACKTDAFPLGEWSVVSDRGLEPRNEQLLRLRPLPIWLVGRNWCPEGDSNTQRMVSKTIVSTVGLPGHWCSLMVTIHRPPLTKGRFCH
jgi:hypothetical protein